MREREGGRERGRERERERERERLIFGSMTQVMLKCSDQVVAEHV